MLKQQLEQKLAAAEQASAKLPALENELAVLEKAKNAAAERLAGLMADVTEVQNDIDQAETDLAALRTQLENRLVSMYMYGGSWSTQYLEALVTEDDLASVLERFDMVTRMASQDHQLFTEVEGYLEQSRADKLLLEKKVAEQQVEADAADASVEQMAAKQAQYDAQYQSLQGQVASLRTQIKKAQAQEAGRSRGPAEGGHRRHQGRHRAQAAPLPPPPSRPPTPLRRLVGRFVRLGQVPRFGRGGQGSGQLHLQDLPGAAQERALRCRWSWRSGESTASRRPQSLAVLNAESGMGSLKWGGRLVSEGNNFGCMGYSANPAWISWRPAISHGKIYVGDRNWMTLLQRGRRHGGLGSLHRLRTGQRRLPAAPAHRQLDGLRRHLLRQERPRQGQVHREAHLGLRHAQEERQAMGYSW